jgi:hypothetical protein
LAPSSHDRRARLVDSLGVSAGYGVGGASVLRCESKHAALRSDDGRDPGGIDDRRVAAQQEIAFPHIETPPATRKRGEQSRALTDDIRTASSLSRFLPGLSPAVRPAPEDGYESDHQDRDHHDRPCGGIHSSDLPDNGPLETGAACALHNRVALG